MKSLEQLEQEARDIAQRSRAKEYARLAALIDSAAPVTEAIPVTRPFSDEPTGEYVHRHQTEGERLREQQIRLTFAKMTVADLCADITGDREAVLTSIREQQAIEQNLAINSLARTALDILAELKRR